MYHIGRREFTLGLASLALSRPSLAAGTIKPDASCALLVIDVQNCFLPGGSLAVKGADKIIPVINRIAKGFANILETQDWHTPHHISFASSHPGHKPFSTIKLPYGQQILWPDHCVEGTKGAQLSKDLHLPTDELVLRKGYNKNVDSYSAFLAADRKTPTGLAGYLRERKISTLFMAGIATDFCVAWSAIDARHDGFNVYVIADACRGIDTHGSLAKAWKDMTAAGVRKIQSADLAV